MSARTLLYAQLITLAFLAALHLIGLEYHFYWRFVWLDTVSHMLGGVWAAFFLFWFRAHLGHAPSITWGIAGALVLGIGWELFELGAGLIPAVNYQLDTSIDLLMDGIGGAVAGWMSRFFAKTR